MKGFKIYKWIKRSVIMLSIFLILFIGLVLFIRSATGQQFIVNKAVSYVSKTTETTIDLKKLYITFSGNIFLEGLYIEDREKDTLLYTKNLEASIAFLPLLRGTAFELKSLDWTDAVINLKRSENTENFNYQFLIDSFVTEDTLATKKPVDEEIDTTPMAIRLGDFDLNAIKATIDDRYSGMKAKLNLGRLEVTIDEFDLEKMRFSIDDIQLAETRIAYHQTKPLPETLTDTTTVPLPTLTIDDLSITDILLDYKDDPSKLTAQIELPELILEDLQANLTDQELRLDSFLASNSTLYIEDKNEIAKSSVPVDSSTIASTNFEWPDWSIKSEEIAIKETSIIFKRTAAIKKTKGFDPNNIELAKLNIATRAFNYQPKSADLQLEEFSFRERSGFVLQQFEMNIATSDTQLTADELVIATTDSQLQGTVKLQFNTLNQFIQHPENTVFQLNIPSIAFDPATVYYLSPELEQNPYLQALSKKAINGKIAASGRAQDFSLTNSRINWGTTTSIETTARIQHATQMDSLRFTIDALEAFTTRKDLTPFIPKEQLATLQPPEKIQFTGNASGTLEKLNFDASLLTSDGTIKTKGTLVNKQTLAFDGMVLTEELQLDKILKNEQLGPLSLQIEAKGKGASINTLDATLRSDIKELEFNNYDFSALQLEGVIKNGKGNLLAAFADDNLNMKLDTGIVLDSIAPTIDAKLQIIGADLNGLGLSRKIIKTQFDLRMLFEGNAADFDLNAALTDATVVYDSEPFSINKIAITAKTNSSKSSLNVKSDFLKGTVEANAAIPIITDALQRHLNKHLKLKSLETKDTLNNPVRMDLQFKFKETPVLSEVFLKGLQSTDTLRINASFDEAINTLNATIKTPNIHYNEGQLDSLNFRLHSTRDDLDFSLDWNAIDYAPLAIKETAITGTLEEDVLFLDFNSADQEDVIARLQTEITFKKDSLFVHLNPNSILLDRTSWNALPNNRIVFAADYMRFEDFEISNNQQKIRMHSDRKNREKEQVHFEFQNFDLRAITSFLNPDQLLVSGALDGTISLEEPFGKTGLVSDLAIRELAITEVPLGLLTIDATSKSFSTYDLTMALQGPSVSLKLIGAYEAAKEQPTFAMELDLQEVKVPLVENFASEFISETKGTLSGSATINGTIDDPNYTGAFHFNDAQLKVNSLNTHFSLPEENIRIDTEGVYLDQFTIADKDQSTFILDGAIKTQELTNPDFDLSLNAKNFQILNSTKEDNELFYGKVTISSKLKITGTMEVPKIRGSIGVDENSDFTLVVPESELAVKEREGVILFVNKKNPDAILTKTEKTGSDVAVIQGFDIDTKLSIGKKSLFKIVIDERSGDYIKVRGKGNLAFGMEPNGRMTLSGRYEINDGQYKASLYNLVKKEFDIASGSAITWNGDPLDADLDVKAIYNVETNASPLMAVGANANATGGSSAYNRAIDFLVYLKVNGELLQPEITFAMDMPESQQGIAGGQVYGRVQQLNNQESELNKQVFSLLVFNRFFPAAGSDGSNGGAASIARDNVNKVLSGQLNNFSDRIIGKTGVELDFQLDSYNNQSTTTTDLEINAQKKLLDDRLIVQVGSAVNVEGNSQATQNSSPIIGNVSLEYLLSENGKYRLKGFRKNEFESVIDGQLIVTGIAFIFNREFNKFKELWTAEAKKTVSENEKTTTLEETIEEKKKKKDKSN